MKCRTAQFRVGLLSVRNGLMHLCNYTCKVRKQIISKRWNRKLSRKTELLVFKRFIGNGPTHGQVIFPFACFPCFMITFPFFLSHYSSSYWYKNSLLLINPWLRKLKPVNIPILLSVQVIAFWVDCGLCRVRVDRKPLYMYKRGIFGGGLGPAH